MAAVCSDLSVDPNPVSYTCDCECKENASDAGVVLLFYRYWTASPVLAPVYLPLSQAPHELASFHRCLASSLRLGGKFRFAKEGFNITVAGSTSSINDYIRACLAHWSFSGLGLSIANLDHDVTRSFFKPTPGCSCVFGREAKFKIASEITPFGVQDYMPAWDEVTKLTPAEFHERLLRDGIETGLIDVRNHYESRIGYFIGASGIECIKPEIRRFSQWPGYVQRHVLPSAGRDLFSDKKQMLTYCTGGIRCEKGASWMRRSLRKEGCDLPVYTLDGGIAAYLDWMAAEITAGRKTAEMSLFKGKNFVFDARGSTSLNDQEQENQMDIVSACHTCGKKNDCLAKCVSARCSLVLVSCADCRGAVRCCGDCAQLDHRELDGKTQSPRTRMCACEQARETSLWGGGTAKLRKS